MAGFNKDELLKRLGNDIPNDLKAKIEEVVEAYQPVVKKQDTHQPVVMNKDEFFNAVFKEIPKSQFTNFDIDMFVETIDKYIPDNLKEFIHNVLKRNPGLYAASASKYYPVVEMTDFVWQIIAANQPKEVKKTVLEAKEPNDKKIDAIINLLVARFARTLYDRLQQNNIFRPEGDHTSISQFVDVLGFHLFHKCRILTTYRDMKNIANPNIKRPSNIDLYSGTGLFYSGTSAEDDEMLDYLTDIMDLHIQMSPYGELPSYPVKKYSPARQIAKESGNWKPYIKLLSEDFRQLLHALYNTTYKRLKMYNFTFNEYVDLVSDRFKQNATTILTEAIGQPEYVYYYMDEDRIVCKYPQRQEDIPVYFETFFGNRMRTLEKMKYDHEKNEKYFDNLYKTGEIYKQTKEYLLGCDTIDDFLEQSDKYKKLIQEQKSIATEYETKLEEKIKKETKQQSRGAGTKELKAQRADIFDKAKNKLLDKIKALGDDSVENIQKTIQIYREAISELDI